MMTTWVAGPGWKITSPSTSTSPVPLVSPSVSVTVSATASFTVTVTDDVPFGMEIGVPPTVAVALLSVTLAV